MRIALLADLHGNLPALEAVIVELERLQPDCVVVDGDIINGAPFSAQTIERVRAMPWTVIRGNHEFYYLDFGTERAVPGSADPDRWGQLHWLMGQITADQGAYLAMLPDDCTFFVPGTQPLRVAHGVPGKNRVGFYRRQSDAAIAAEIEHVREQTLISAHTHVQIDRHIVLDDIQAALAADPHAGADGHGHEALQPRHWHVINPGSVGLPLDGHPGAQFALIEAVPEYVEAGGWQVAHFFVGYDLRATLSAFHSTGMLEAGGVISQLFYWEIVTGEPEIIRFYRWAFANGIDPDKDPIRDTFQRYITDSGRDQYIRARDPLA